MKHWGTFLLGSAFGTCVAHNMYAEAGTVWLAMLVAWFLFLSD